HLDDGVTRLFYQPLRDVSAVEYRHQVFGDLERSEVRQSIKDFTDAMAMMRGQLSQAGWGQHRRQRHGWFVRGVSTFCTAVAALRDNLADGELSSSGLRDVADYLRGYVDS